MKIVIDIPKEMILSLEQGSFGAKYNMYDLIGCVMNGTPLPAGHGRLIDGDRTLMIAWQNFYKHEDEWEKKDENYLPIHGFYDQNGFECCQQTIVNAPTIIEADKGSDSK